MNRLVVMLLFGSMALICFSNFYMKEELAPVYAAGLVLMIPLLIYFHGAMKKKDVQEARARALMEEAHRMHLARSEARSKIPKNNPRRDSALAIEGAKRLSAVRSMAVLVRKPRLREKALEVCEFAELVLETIRHMPDDTPAAAAFVDNHLSRFFETLERCFDLYRKGHKDVSAAESDSGELESFSLFIALFRKQQDHILFEGFGSGKGRGITA